MKPPQRVARMASGLGRLWARSGLAGFERQAAEALRLFGDANEQLRGHDQVQGRHTARLALRTLGVSDRSRAGREVLAAVGAIGRGDLEPEALAIELRGFDPPRLIALCRGLAYLGSFRASAVVRRVARDVLLETSTQERLDERMSYLAALTDAGQIAEARSVLDRLSGTLQPDRAVRSLALACGYSGDWVWRHWSAQPATRALVGGSDVLLVGPALALSGLVDAAAKQSIVATFKYCGRPTDAVPGARVDITVLNGHAYAELQRRFGSHGGAYTMSPCRLLLFKNKSRPPFDLGIAVERLEARPKLMVEKANLGLMVVTEFLLAGANTLSVTGFDLWTKPVTARSEYSYFAPDNRTRRDGGLDRGSVARSAGIHEPISQFNYLKRLVEVGRVNADQTLQHVLAMSDDEYAAQLEASHGFPFVRHDNDVEPRSRGDGRG